MIESWHEWSELLRHEMNVDVVEVIGWESSLISRRVKPLLPRIGKKLGSKIPEIMDAAQRDEVEYLRDGSVRLAGVVLAPDEVEIIAVPKPGTEIAHDQGIVVVIDTNVTIDLLRRGDAREIQRAVQELRKVAALDPDELADLWIVGSPEVIDPLKHLLSEVAADTLTLWQESSPPADLPTVDEDVSGGSVTIGLRGRGAAS